VLVGDVLGRGFAKAAGGYPIPSMDVSGSPRSFQRVYLAILFAAAAVAAAGGLFASTLAADVDHVPAGPSAHSELALSAGPRR